MLFLEILFVSSFDVAFGASMRNRWFTFIRLESCGAAWTTEMTGLDNGCQGDVVVDAGSQVVLLEVSSADNVVRKDARISADADHQFVGRIPVDRARYVEGGQGEAGIVFADACAVEIDHGAELRLVNAEQRDGVLHRRREGTVVPEVITLLVGETARVPKVL